MSTARPRPGRTKRSRQQPLNRASFMSDFVENAIRRKPYYGIEGEGRTHDKPINTPYGAACSHKTLL